MLFVKGLYKTVYPVLQSSGVTLWFLKGEASGTHTMFGELLLLTQVQV